MRVLCIVFAVLAGFLGLVLPALPALAISYSGNGKFDARVALSHDEKQSYSVYFEHEWRVWTLLGEPVSFAKIRWRLNEEKILIPTELWKLHGSSQYHLHLRDVPPDVMEKVRLFDVQLMLTAHTQKSATQHVLGKILLDPGAPAKQGNTWSFSVPGSPNWDEFILNEWYAPTLGLDSDYWTEEQAKFAIGTAGLEPYSLLGNGGVSVVRAKLDLSPIFNWAREKHRAETQVNKVNEMLDVYSRSTDVGIGPASELLDHAKDALKSSNFEDVAEITEQVQEFVTVASEQLLSAEENVEIQTLSLEIKTDLAALETVPPWPSNAENWNLNKRNALAGMPAIDPNSAASFASGNASNSAKGGAVRAGANQILFLIDTSGSMDGERLTSAKKAAIESLSTSVGNGIDVGVLAFSGDCDSPISARHEFSRDVSSLTNFVQQLSAGGGTPLATALSVANNEIAEYAEENGGGRAVIVLADGDDNCGGIGSVVSQLKETQKLSRHETVGLEVGFGSEAAKQLQLLASESGGNYHAASDVDEVSEAFADALQNMGLLNMLGAFGRPSVSAGNNGDSSVIFWDNLGK